MNFIWYFYHGLLEVFNTNFFYKIFFVLKILAIKYFLENLNQGVLAFLSVSIKAKNRARLMDWCKIPEKKNFFEKLQKKT